MVDNDVSADSEITSAAAWQTGEILELPSGKRIRAIRPSLLTLIGSGVFPNSLLTIARKVMEGQVEPDIDPEDLPGLTKVMDITAASAFLEPKCVYDVPPSETPKGCINVAWVTDDDKQFLMMWTQQGTAFLESFRRQQDAGDAVGLPGPEVQPETVNVAGDSGLAGSAGTG